jgi:hypothetical protein
VPLPEARPNIKPAARRVAAATIAAYRRAMKRRPPRSRNCRPPRRKRGLSEEERALWESVAKQVKPLRKKQRAAEAGLSQRRRRGRPREAGSSAKAPPRRPKFRAPRLATAGRRRWRRSDAASARSFRAAERRSMPGSTCTA